MVTITLKDLRIAAKVGWPEAERNHPQIITINLSLDVEASSSFTSDHVEDTLNYDDVIAFLKESCASTTWRLLEKMSHDLAQGLLSTFAQIRKIKIDLSKNIYSDAAAVTVSYEAVGGEE
jgi:dihydroneopterin aldolase